MTLSYIRIGTNSSTLATQVTTMESCTVRVTFVTFVLHLPLMLQKQLPPQQWVHALTTATPFLLAHLYKSCPVFSLFRIHTLADAQKPRYYRNTPVLIDLHWLPVRHRIEFKVKNCYQCFQGVALPTASLPY